MLRADAEELTLRICGSLVSGCPKTPYMRHADAMCNVGYQSCFSYDLLSEHQDEETR